MEKDFWIEKEVMHGLVNSVYAQTLNQFVKSGDEDLRMKSRDIWALQGAVRAAKTVAELEEVEKRLKAFCFSPKQGIGDK
jgi:hypothetical protein